MIWWLWVLLGLALLILEVATPTGFVLLFFGISSILVGLIVALGLGGPAWLQWLLFSAISVTSVLALRRPLNERFQRRDGVPAVDALVGDLAIPIEEIPAGAVGKAELRGSSWSVRNLHDASVTRGQRCRVERVEGLTLHIRPE